MSQVTTLARKYLLPAEIERNLIRQRTTGALARKKSEAVQGPTS